MKPVSKIIEDRAYIGNYSPKAISGAVFEVKNPANGQVLANISDLGAEDVTRAIDLAATAFPKWRALTTLERSQILRTWADLITENAEDLAILMTLEQGKPVSEARGEVLAGADTIRWCAEEGRRLYGEYIEGAKKGTKIVISRHPVGVVGAITPWNFPVSMITRKVGPALAAGCTIVLKPAEATPLCALALAHIAHKSGLPNGVLTIITSTKPAEISKAMTGDVRVRKISFTGSTSVGKRLMMQASSHIQKISLELGGNAPFIVFPTADLDKVVEGAMASKFRNAGQTCICANRIYVHEKIIPAFTEKLLNKINALKVGNGWDKDVAIGPMINSEAVERIEKLVNDAEKAGGKILTGGRKHVLGYNFFEPTLITGVPDNHAIAKEEIFGPVAVLYSFKTEEEVVRRANDTEYGLSSYLYTQDLGQAWRVSDALDYGMVAINEPFLATDLAPFGGVKISGIGKEGGQYGLLEFTNTRYRLFG